MSNSEHTHHAHHASAAPTAPATVEKPPATKPHGGHAGHDHAAMVADYRRRFWVSLALTVPVLALAEMIQHWLGVEEGWAFPGRGYLEFVFASAIFFYGGWPFLTGLMGELRRRRPGMMTLIALAISVAYVYSSVVVFGLPGEVFFWELATLIDIMLLGHWIEMRSVMGASRALEELVASACRPTPIGCAPTARPRTCR